MTELNITGSGGGGNLTTTEVIDIDITTDAHWIISVVGSVVIILTNLFIAVAFIYHVISTKVSKKKKSRRDVNGGLVMILAMVTIVVPFLRYFGTLYFLFVSLHPEYENGCEIAYDICVTGFGLAILPNYAFLWARQREFIDHPSLGHIFGICVGIFSKTSLLLIMATGSCLVVLGVYPVEYTHGRGGCVLIGEEEQAEYRTYVYAFVMISAQLVLLGLFLHPIRLHAQGRKGMHDGDVTTSKSEMAERSSDIKTPKQYRTQSLPYNNNLITVSKMDSIGPSYSDSEMFQVSRNRPSTVQYDNASDKTPQRQKSLVPKAVSNLKSRMRTKRVYGLIRRILYLALISIFSDLTIMLINGFLIPDDIPQTYAFVLYDFNLLINVITVVLSFENWRKMMTSPFKRKEKK